MILATLGWTVIHSLWIGSAIVGVTALLLALLGDRRARLRHGLAFSALLAMAAAPALVAVTAFDPMIWTVRVEVTDALEATVGFGRFVSLRSWVVPAAALIWMPGAVVGLIRLAAQWRHLRQWRRDGALAQSSDIAPHVHALMTAMRVPRPVEVRHSDRATAPMVFGWRCPTILLPHRITDTLTAEQLRGVLAHELAHVGRRDYLVNLLQVVVESLLWFHPAAHWLSRRVRTEREYCCDDEAVRTGVDVPTYARALAALNEARDGGRLAVAAASGTLLDCIQRMAGRPRSVLTVRAAVLVLVATTVVASVFFTLAMAVPPAVPLDALLRMRSPAPPGVVVPTGPSLPRSPRRR